MNIKKKISEKYKNSILVDEKKIDIEVREGIVHLTGAVASHVIKNEAYMTALHTEGVIDVVDELTIR